MPLVEKARAAAGLDGEGPVARHVSACLANADLPVEHEALESAIVAQGWGGSIEVFNDTFALLRAGLDEPRGVAVVCGAGINCAGLLPGRQHRALRRGRPHLRRLGRRRATSGRRRCGGPRAPRTGADHDTVLSDALPRHAGLGEHERADRGRASRHCSPRPSAWS